ncbi:MAG: efflux RND transporter periplasmic adaptor subunit [Candidatus Moranbacteria bacterium]|jgi:RND family efflux transporter MFP subunit|nr:efflux RND transporter periplasmic adaptor subunit [Candidatus Moranbacteria bacterium]MBP9801403.1 efflux RND transporter periplasmic adaptor subunit [Candidatus Moranbacteria bacterium]
MMQSIFTWGKRHWKLITIGVVFAGGAYWYFGNSSSATQAPVQKTVTVERGDLRVVVSGSGQVEAVSQVDLTPVIAGDGIDVLLVQVENNQMVKKGQVIAVLDTQDAVRDIKNAQLNLQNAKIKQKQTEDMYEKQTKTDLWNRQLQEIGVAQSQNSLSKAQEKLADYSIKAPFDGIVTGLSVEAGDSVARNTILASVITPERKIVVNLNEVDAARVVEGNRVELSFNALPNLILGGKVSRIATIGKVTQNVVSYEADIELDEQNDSIKPGMSVSADILVVEKKNVLLLPNAALSTDEDGQVTVKKRMNNRSTPDTRGTEAQAIEIGLTNDIQTEVTSGINEGDKVILPSITTSATKAASGGSVLSSLFRGSGRNNR